MIPLSLTLGLSVNWRLENLAVSQQAEVHIANELLPMSNWAEIKNTVPCRKLMTAFLLNVLSFWKVTPPRLKLPVLLYKIQWGYISIKIVF